MYALVYMRDAGELAVQDRHSAYPQPTFGLNITGPEEIQGWKDTGWITSGTVHIPCTSVDRIDGPIAAGDVPKALHIVAPLPAA